MHKLLDIEFLVRAPEVETEFDVSPAGDCVAFTDNRTGRFEVYLLDLETQVIRQLTDHGQGATCPRFSPGGEYVLYAQDHDGDERWDFHLIHLATGRSRCVLEQCVAGYPAVSWSPDGRALLITSARDGRFTLHRCDIETGALTPLTRHAFNDERGVYSPDGRWIAFDAHTIGQDRGVFVIAPDGSDIRALPLPDAADPQWSPDGRFLLFHSMRESEDVGVFELATGEVRWLAEGRWDEWGAAWSPDGRQALYLENEDGVHRVCVVNVASGERIARIAPEDGVIERARFARGGRSVVFEFSNHRTPNSLWEYHLDTRVCEQITPPLEVAHDAPFIAPYYVRYESADGLTVPAIVYPSRQAGRDGGAILLIHGGPTWAYHNFWHPAAQHFAQMGYTVIGPNYRGSTGYGRAYQNANRYDIGRGDVLDCIAGVEWLLREGMAGRGRIGVTGASQGGYMTMMCLAKHPDYWAAGSSLIGFFNYFTEFESEREDLRYWDLQNMGDPAKPEDAERYRDRSPIFFIDRVTAPVQLIAGRTDPRCPAAETEQVHRALRARGVPVEMILYENEGHGFSKVENRIDAYRRRAEFFAQHLG
ncbi:MAG: acylaminoacyl-peptidase [Candidatus Roseilinea sp.]|nr:MAG: acylaminoacyl-peptidase [Candidatus Roseilinea sp.]